MTDKEYRRFTEEQLKGRKAKLMATVKTGKATIPAGTMVTITGKFNGLMITTDPCPHCQCSHHVRFVNAKDLLLMPQSN